MGVGVWPWESHSIDRGEGVVQPHCQKEPTPCPSGHSEFALMDLLSFSWLVVSMCVCVVRAWKSKRIVAATWLVFLEQCCLIPWVIGCHVVA